MRYVWQKNDITGQWATGTQVLYNEWVHGEFPINVLTTSTLSDIEPEDTSSWPKKGYIVSPDNTYQIQDKYDVVRISPNTYCQCVATGDGAETTNVYYIDRIRNISIHSASENGIDIVIQGQEVTYEASKGSANGTVSNTSSGAYPAPTAAKKRRIAKGLSTSGRIRVHAAVHTNCRNRLLFRRRAPRLPSPPAARLCIQCSPSPGRRLRGTQSARRGR